MSDQSEKRNEGMGGLPGLAIGAAIGGIMAAQGKGPLETLGVVTAAFVAAKLIFGTTDAKR